MTRHDKSKSKVTSDSLHNKNCFAYLEKLVISDAILATFPKELQQNIQTIRNQKGVYNADIPYADIYTSFFNNADKTINEIENLEGFKTFIDSIYNNDNDILETTFETIKDITQARVPSGTSIEKTIANRMQDSSQTINKGQTPAQAGSSSGRFYAMIAKNFKPQHTTSLATVRKYDYNTTSNNPTEYRFGTQGERHHGNARISPLFEAWLKQTNKGQVQDPDKKIQHIYFNNLGWDRTDFEGKREKALTDKLHALENSHPNIAVITLPADKGLMNHHKYEKTNDKHDYQTVFNEFLAISSKKNPNKESKKSNDFYISPKIRELVFGTNDEEVLKELLTRSFDALGIKKNQTLSSAERQAVWFHFIKFELTNHIIQKLQPSSINFSCKDAIDRGGVSSAYYNLIKSFETSRPMSRDEFDRGLHAAPTMVKARGMNAHLNMIWNTVDAYVNANYTSLKEDNSKAWLIEWRDMNCPQARVDDLLKLRVQQIKGELDVNNRGHDNARKILENIEKQSNIGVSGKRLLLEAAVLTPKIILQTNEEALVERYEKLADQLRIKYPVLKVLSGLMKCMLGLGVLSKERFNSGMETMNAGTNFRARSELQQQMKTNIQQQRDAQKESTSAEMELPKSLSSQGLFK